MTITRSRATPDSPQVRRRLASDRGESRGYLALTAALYPDEDAVCGEILEFNLATEGDDFEHAYKMIVEAAEGAISAARHGASDSLDRFLADNNLSVYPRPPRTYRPAAVPSHLLRQPGLILRPVSISIEAAIRE